MKVYRVYRWWYGGEEYTYGTYSSMNNVELARQEIILKYQLVSKDDLERLDVEEVTLDQPPKCPDFW